MRGGARKGAGRKKGGGDARLRLVRDILEAHRTELISTALRMATGRKPDRVVLCKLVDKILPDLKSQEISAVVRQEAFSSKSALDDAKRLLDEFAMDFGRSHLPELLAEKDAPKSLPVSQPVGARPDRQPG